MPAARVTPVAWTASDHFCPNPNSPGFGRVCQARPPPAWDPPVPITNNVVNGSSDCGSHPSLVFAYRVLSRFTGRHVLSSLAGGVPWRRNTVIDLTEAELNICQIIKLVLTADADVTEKKHYLVGLFKVYTPLRA